MMQSSTAGITAPFRERNFRLFFGGQLVSVIGTCAVKCHSRSVTALSRENL